METICEMKVDELGWVEITPSNQNENWRSFRFKKNHFTIAFNHKSEEEILENLKALTPDKNVK